MRKGEICMVYVPDEVRYDFYLSSGCILLHKACIGHSVIGIDYKQAQVIGRVCDRILFTEDVRRVETVNQSPQCSDNSGLETLFLGDGEYLNFDGLLREMLLSSNEPPLFCVLIILLHNPQ
jgi:hypothetical protein